MDYKSIFLGYYNTELEGAKAYNDYASYLNLKENTNYELNDIHDITDPLYSPTPRDVPEEYRRAHQETKTSKYTGVSYSLSRQNWVVSIKFRGKTYNLGSYTDELEAAICYNQQALYFNNNFSTKYKVNDIPDWDPTSKNIIGEKYELKKSRKSSQYIGVNWNSQTNKWRSTIVFNKRQLHLGFYGDERAAAEAYNRKASELNAMVGDITKYKLNKF